MKDSNSLEFLQCGKTTGAAFEAGSSLTELAGSWRLEFDSTEDPRSGCDVTMLGRLTCVV